MVFMSKENAHSLISSSVLHIRLSFIKVAIIGHVKHFTRQSPPVLNNRIVNNSVTEVPRTYQKHMHSRTFSGRFRLCHVVSVSTLLPCKNSSQLTIITEISQEPICGFLLICSLAAKEQDIPFLPTSMHSLFFLFLNSCNLLAPLCFLSFSLTRGPHQQSFLFNICLDLKNSRPQHFLSKSFNKIYFCVEIVGLRKQCKVGCRMCLHDISCTVSKIGGKLQLRKYQ